MLTMLKNLGLNYHQAEVCAELLKGKTNREIGKALFRTETCVKYHMTNVYKFFNLTTYTGGNSRLRLYKLLKDHEVEYRTKQQIIEVKEPEQLSLPGLDLPSGFTG